MHVARRKAAARRNLAKEPIEGLEQIRAWRRGQANLRSHAVERGPGSHKVHHGKDSVTVECGSGNVFADLGFPNPEELKLKVQLAVEVNRLLKRRRLQQDKAAKVLGLRRPLLSELMRYRLARFSVGQLMDLLTRLGKDVQIRIASRPPGCSRTAVRVHHAH